MYTAPWALGLGRSPRPGVGPCCFVLCCTQVIFNLIGITLWIYRWVVFSFTFHIVKASLSARTALLLASSYFILRACFICLTSFYSFLFSPYFDEDFPSESTCASDDFLWLLSPERPGVVALVWGGASGWGRLGAEPLPQGPECWAGSLPAVSGSEGWVTRVRRFKSALLRQTLIIRGRSCVEEHSSPLDNPQEYLQDKHNVLQ